MIFSLIFMIYIKPYNKNMLKRQYKPLFTLKHTNSKNLHVCQQSNGHRVVVKAISNESRQTIQNQIKVYQKIKEPHLHGFAQVRQVFEQNGVIHLVMEKLGSNLQTLRVKCGGRLTLKTVMMVASQMLERIQFLHKTGFIHGDIKPSNFLIGNKKLKHKIYLTDFQLSTAYEKQGKHIVSQTKENFSGSLRFCSKNTHKNKSTSRRDDIQSWLYSLIFLCKGDLPWLRLNSSNFIDANSQLHEAKTKSQEQLLWGLPQTFKDLYDLIVALKFNQKPNYAKYYELLLGLMKKQGYEMDYKYDWQYL